MSLLRRLAGRLGVDRAALYVLLGRGWSTLAAPVTLFFVATFLSKEEQGYYYVFVNVAGISIFFELGIVVVLIHFASHEKATLTWTSEGTLTGDPAAKARLAWLLRLAVKWYAVVGLLIFSITLPTGLWFFAGAPGASGQVNWLLPWVFTALVCATTCALTPLWAILEGCGLVAEINWVRLIQQLLNGLVIWLVLGLHGGLYSWPFVLGCNLLWSGFWLWTRRRRLLLDLFRYRQAQAAMSWQHDFWPMQWRYAVTSLCAYVVTQIPGALLLRMHSPAAAGEWGMSLTVATTVMPLGAAWLSTKVPRMGVLVAHRNYVELDRLFRQQLLTSTAVVVAASVSIFCGFVGLHYLHGHVDLWLATWPPGLFRGVVTRLAAVEQRVLPLGPLALVMAGGVAAHINNAYGAYLRSHKREPFFVLYIINAVFMMCGALTLGWRFGGTGMAISYFIACDIILLGGGTWIFFRKRREWHRASPPEAAPAPDPVGIGGATEPAGVAGVSGTPDDPP